MTMISSLLASVLGAAVFWYAVPLSDLSRAAASSITALSIITAAVFVRLNRGMPNLDWKGAAASQRTNLTQSIVSLTREYSILVGVNAVFLVGALVLVGAGPDAHENLLPYGRGIITSSAGFLTGLVVSRMAYVVWRDYDIVVLQKHLVDAASEAENIKTESAAASLRREQIAASQLRSQPSITPQPWED